MTELHYNGLLLTTIPANATPLQVDEYAIYNDLDQPSINWLVTINDIAKLNSLGATSSVPYKAATDLISHYLTTL